MVRYGEYSPRNPNILSPGKLLLGLGEYEEKRRQLLEKKKKEYREQISQARVTVTTQRNRGYDEESVSSRVNTVGQDDLLSVGTSLHIPATINPSPSENEKRRMEKRNGGLQDYHHTDNEEGTMSLTSPLTLQVPEDALLQNINYSSLSPRERKLAELRESEMYNPSFYENRASRGSTQQSDGGPMHISQTTDQLPDVRRRRVAYQEELRKQIEEKHRIEAEQREREKKEEEALMRRIEQQQERMRLEYEREEAQRKLRQEQRLQQTEQFYLREEELKLEARRYREDLMRKKRGMNENGDMKDFSKEILNDTRQNYLEKSLPVPALRNKSHPVSQAQLNNESVTNFYQSPKEITNIIDYNLHPLENNVSKETISKESRYHKPRNPTQDLTDNIQRSYKLELSLPIPSVSSKLSQEHNAVEPKVYYHQQCKNLSARNQEEKNSSSGATDREPAFTIIQPEVKRTRPAIQKNILRTSDVLSEARPNNVLTQLGAFRRQMEIDQLKMEERLQQSLQQKSSSV